jgi:hypothetical protein
MTTLSNTSDKIGEKDLTHGIIGIARTSTNVLTASLQGALGQARVLGGTIGLSVATIVLNRSIVADLSGTLSPTQVSNLQQSITTIFDLDPREQVKVAGVFANSFKTQMRICMYLSAAALVAALFTWQKNPASVADSKSQPDTVDETRKLEQCSNGN